MRDKGYMYVCGSDCPAWLVLLEWNENEESDHERLGMSETQYMLARGGDLSLSHFDLCLFLRALSSELCVVKLRCQQASLEERDESRLTPQALHKLLGPSGPRRHSAVTVDPHP
jgi:hypothetical protein